MIRCNPYGKRAFDAVSTPSGVWYRDVGTDAWYMQHIYVPPFSIARVWVTAHSQNGDIPPETEVLVLEGTNGEDGVLPCRASCYGLPPMASATPDAAWDALASACVADFYEARAANQAAAVLLAEMGMRTC